MYIRENLTLKGSRERSFSRSPFPDILLQSGSNNFKLGSQPSQSERSRRYPDEQMVPQNNYTLKHNSLTKSSSWRGAHCLLDYGKHGWPPYCSSKPKAHEEWRFENSHCGSRAALTTPSDKVCPSSLFSGKSLRKWNPATQTKRSPTREHHKQHRHPHPRCVSPSPHLHQFRHDLQQQAIPDLQPDSRTLFAHLYENIFFRGTWSLLEMAKWVLAEPTTDSVSTSDEVISSCRITLFSHIPWNSKTWLSIASFTCLINLLRPHYNFDEFFCQQRRQHEISRNRWGMKLKTSSFRNFAYLDLFTH